MSGGCYKPLNEYNGEAMYSPSRENRSNGYVVGATPGGTEDPHDVRYRVPVLYSLFVKGPRDKGKRIIRDFNLWSFTDSGMIENGIPGITDH